jgi:hypothetical protein
MTMSETLGTVILARKTKRLQETHSPYTPKRPPLELLKLAIIRPAKLLTQSPICLSISLYVAVTQSYLYILFTTLTGVFTTQYHWHGGITGLPFLGLGVGSLVGLFMYMVNKFSGTGCLLFQTTPNRPALNEQSPRYAYFARADNTVLFDLFANL